MVISPVLLLGRASAIFGGDKCCNNNLMFLLYFGIKLSKSNILVYTQHTHKGKQKDNSYYSLSMSINVWALVHIIKLNNQLISIYITIYIAGLNLLCLPGDVHNYIVLPVE